MKSFAIIRLFILGLISATLLSLLSLFSLKKALDSGANEHRRYFILSIANSIENRPLDKSSLDFVPGEIHRPTFIGGRPPFRRPPSGSPRLNMWLISESGEIISSTSEKKLPSEWRKLGLPKETHEFSSDESFFKISQILVIVKLDTKTPAYLIVLPEESRIFSGPLFLTQSILTFTTVCLAIFFSLFFTFMYLRRKSQDAKSVLLRLERGDLKARFEIKRMDEFGNLMLDFNRMANEIERLVLRIHEAEKSRKNLLQELGHDLRTPLTSLTTAYETLKFHFQKINENDREELFNIMGGEINYLRDLLEKLLTIATLDEPHYKKSTETVDLENLLSHEIKSRQSVNNAPKSLQWNFKSQLSSRSSSATNPETILGDPHLLMRLLRNGLDNASKYARCKIDIALIEKEHHFEITIDDDGPGFSGSALESFGKRKEYRARAARGLDYSIGLGSVIMKTVAELHGGSVEIHNKVSNDGFQGAQLKIILPKFF